MCVCSILYLKFVKRKNYSNKLSHCSSNVPIIVCCINICLNINISYICNSKIIERAHLGSLRQFNEDLKKMRLVLIREVYKYHSRQQVSKLIGI